MEPYRQHIMDRQWFIKLVIILICAFPFARFAEAIEDTSDSLTLSTTDSDQPGYKLGLNDSKPLMQDDELHPDFVKLLEPYPEALQAANDSLGYSGITVAGNAVMTLGVILALSSSIDDANNLNNDQLPDDNDGQSQALGVVIIGAAISLAGVSQAKGAMNRALEIFNKNYNKNTNRNLLDEPRYTAQSMKRNSIKPYFLFGDINKSRSLLNDTIYLTGLTYTF